MTVKKIGDKVLLVFEKQDKTQEAEKRKRKKLLKKVVDKEKKLWYNKEVDLRTLKIKQ